MNREDNKREETRKKDAPELTEEETEVGEESAEENLDPVARAEFDRVVGELDVATKEAIRQAARAEEMTLAAQRLQADFDNFRKRNADAVGRARKDGESAVLTELLPALDVFESALAMIGDEAVAQGVRMIRNKITDTFASFGAEQIPSLGETFDPEFHDAIEQVDAGDAESGTIVAVLQQGYRRGDKILRPALVKVAR